MKKILLIVSLFITSSVSLFAQDDEDDGNEKIRDKMAEYIQQRLNLSDAEAKKFTPVFVQYFKEWRQTVKDNRGEDKKLDRDKKVIDLQIRYRAKFQEVIGEKRGNQVFDHQRKFIAELKVLRQNRIRNRGGR